MHFKPGGAFPFLGCPAGEFGDSHVDLETLWGPRARELRERLAESRTPMRRFILLNRYLTDHLSFRLKHHWAVPFVLEALRGSGAGTKVRDVVRQVGLSRRHLIEVFRAQVGMTPKLYSRVQRFQQVFDIASRTTAPDWGQVACDHGYSDQPHLIRDFFTFSGLSPADYVRPKGLGYHAAGCQADRDASAMDSNRTPGGFKKGLGSRTHVSCITRVFSGLR